MKARTIIALFFAGWAIAAIAQETQEVEISGQAAIYEGDKAQARDKAIDDALRKAVEQAVGTMISSETITENYQLLSDRIYSKAEGYVKKFRITDEREEDGVYIVQIKAEVALGQVQGDLESLNLLMQRKEMPRVLVMVAEQNIGVEKPAYWWSGALLSEDMRVVETTLMEIMKAKGFNFIDPATLTGKKKVKMAVAYLSDKQAARVGKTSEAEVVIFGKAVARDIGQSWEGTRMRSANAAVQVQAVNTSNGEVIAVASEEATVPHVSPAVAGRQALRKASEKIAAKLIEQIAAKWVAETSSAASVRITVTGVQNSRMLKKLEEVLSNQVRGVKAVHQRSFSAGSALLDVMLAGKTRDLAAELEAKDFGGVFKLEVESISPNALKLKLIP